MTTEDNNQKKNPDSDRTSIYSNEPIKAKPVSDDSTRVTSSGAIEDATQISSGPKKQDPAPSNPFTSASEQKSPSAEDLKKLKSEQKNKVSTGAFAAGVGGAAAAGVAAGTVFSDEIKGVFTPFLSDAPESPESEIVQVTPQAISDQETGQVDQDTVQPSTAQDESSHLGQTQHENVSGTDMESGIHMSFADQTGHYEVTCIDLDADGAPDSLITEAQLADGSSISFSASGEALHSLLNDGYQVAGNSDFLQESAEMGFCVNELPGAENNGLASYQIQYGDTLSEIAKENHTTIAHLMELNPEISDANQIFAGHQIIIPTDDLANNPYDGWNPGGTNVTAPLEELDPAVPLENGQFVNMDWGSFEDSPVEEYSGNDEYSSLLASSNFDDFSVPDTYFSSDNDNISLDFI